ncbi:MAG: SDR family NAD(P)-dependent oxidoreductase [Alphaproteobacteria bacterium]|nr:SDR family NAD(P)-dependent oxidoreductase [Alphaproteobacteria bacterium]
MKAMDLTGRVALVTGGSRGIGAATAILLAEAGAAVGVNYVANEEAAASTVAAIEAAGGTAIAVRGDVTDKDAVTLMTGTVEDRLGPIDILVASAGISQRLEMEETTEEDFNNILQANLTSAFLCSQAVIPGMRERGWGRLIYVSSGAAYNGGRVGIHYSAAKGGMEALCRAYALRMMEEGVTANCVAPIMIETDMSSTATEKNKRFSPPVGRGGHVDEVSTAVLMLATNAYMTGQTVHMNGGLYFN